VDSADCNCFAAANQAAGEDHEMFRVIIPATPAEAHVTFLREGLQRLDPLFFDWRPKTTLTARPVPA